jgi:transglutaminase-like putative cysteine protease
MKLRVSHLTRYEYVQSVSFSPHALYLRPRESADQRVTRFAFNISPHGKITSSLDVYDNPVSWVNFWDQSTALNIRSEFDVETLGANPFDFILVGGAARLPFEYSAYDKYMLTPYLNRPSAEAQNVANDWLTIASCAGIDETVAFLVQLSSQLNSRIKYTARLEPGIQTMETTLQTGSGTCRDFAVAMIEILRGVGVAARFVSGYIAEREGAQHADNAMHAWVEVYLPGAGWKGIDPTHGVFCDDHYIAVAHAPRPECVSPVQGSYYSPVAVPSELTTRVLVERV